LLKEVHPRLGKVAILSNRTPAMRDSLVENEAAARQLGLRLQSFWIDANPDSLDSAFAAIVRARPDGLVVQPDPLTNKHGVRIAEFAVENGLPSMGGVLPFVTDGGLLTYGGNFVEGWRLAARYVDRILKGARPADLPVEQPASFALGLNLKTAKALGLVVPQSLLLRADLVIR
jgi:putative ABC transport system substrate-binding protein